MKGITNGCVKSLGALNAFIFIDYYNKIEHTFYIVEDDFPIPADGILGRDFFLKYKCKLDYQKWLITLHLGHTKISVAIFSGTEDNVLYIPPRCEVIRRIKLNRRNDALIVNEELIPGVFVARTIVSAENPLVRIINTRISISLRTTLLTTTFITSKQIPMPDILI